MSDKIIKESVLQKGAEACLYFGHWFGKDVIFKHRLPKKYRIEELDQQIRIARTLNEARALIKVKNYGLNVPQVFDIDLHDATIVMKYIPGKKLKDILYNLDDQKKIYFFKTLGAYIALLHQNGHVHGDITTSNLIVTDDEELFLIDFGLHEYSDSIEDKSVDLHLLKRVLISSHGKNFEICFNAFLDGYQSSYSKNDMQDCKSIIKNIAVIETRGRYVKKEERR
ncbi:MAG: Kae1-associated serine/threonine protein kinase [Promethearchaeota archaeon]|nr:MAG: Kae1-associated serine/threonine protein kinase [Candidatus Lokiarchaeota archaeon]